MSETGFNEGEMPGTVRDELMTEMFAHFVIQNTNMALMFLGQMPNPQTGELHRDLDAAKMFIDQLDMLEFKTMGNLTHDEEKLLQQSLMHLRMSFVQAVENPPKAEPPQKAETPTASAVAPETPAAANDSAGAGSGKRFSKKF